MDMFHSLKPIKKCLRDTFRDIKKKNDTVYTEKKLWLIQRVMTDIIYSYQN